jgi:hypoxanthine phosphoribosyltransferase
VVIVDDWFETGQSAMAAKELIERCVPPFSRFAPLSTTPPNIQTPKSFSRDIHFFRSLI